MRTFARQQYSLYVPGKKRKSNTKNNVKIKKQIKLSENKVKKQQNTCKHKAICAAFACSFAVVLHYYRFSQKTFLIVGHVWLPSLNITVYGLDF